MTKEDLQGFFKGAESDRICFEGSCHDCKKPVSVKVDLGEDGEVETSGGAIYFAGASEKKLYLKCDECFNMDSTLRNYQPCLCYSRIVGYLTPMSSWHDGKIAEKNQRVDFKVDPEQLKPEYSKVLNKLTMLCEEAGILFIKKAPAYSSQRCSSCGVICKSNRCDETYKCACGNIMDADFNAACNILFMGQYGVHALQPSL